MCIRDRYRGINRCFCLVRLRSTCGNPLQCSRYGASLRSSREDHPDEMCIRDRRKDIFGCRGGVFVYGYIITMYEINKLVLQLLVEQPAFNAVSYTHLDVYKRQDNRCFPFGKKLRNLLCKNVWWRRGNRHFHRRAFRKLAALDIGRITLIPDVYKRQAHTTMEHLKEHNLDTIIKGLKQPVLGICLGMQLMCRHSEEGDVYKRQVMRTTK